MSQLFATPWTVAHQAPPSVGFSRQEYWSRLPCHPLGDLPDPGIEPSYVSCIGRWVLNHQCHLGSPDIFYITTGNEGGKVCLLGIHRLSEVSRLPSDPASLGDPAVLPPCHLSRGSRALAVVKAVKCATQ